MAELGYKAVVLDHMLRSPTGFQLLPSGQTRLWFTSFSEVSSGHVAPEKCEGLGFSVEVHTGPLLSMVAPSGNVGQAQGVRDGAGEAAISRTLMKSLMGEKSHSIPRYQLL